MTKRQELSMRKMELLTIEDVMRVLRLSRITIYRAIYSGRLKAIKVGGGHLWRIRPDALESYIRDGSRSWVRVNSK